MLEIGTKAPDFELPDQNGELHKLSEYLGKKVILYFYPKDNTPGCTKQACGFSERYPKITEKGAMVLGISKDSVASHKKFEEKYKELCQFVVETPQGGTIDEDGKYMAPVTKGIYKINAIGNESQHVAYAMVVVKGT